MEQKFIDKEIAGLKETNIEKLKKLFPNIFKDGQIDFEELKEQLGDIEEVKEEKYEFTWAGKKEAKQNYKSGISGVTLKYCPEESKDPETTENIYIEGENLKVLKLLKNNYTSSIKMIYIDPPYNTGKDVFIYSDNFKKSSRESEEELGIIEDGEKTINILKDNMYKNAKESNQYHSTWLSMMYPRLKIAHELLAPDGVIFISIDDNELANLKKMCDEIFGEENLLEIFHIQVRYDNKSLTEKDDFQKLMEYTLIYAKNKDEFYPKKPYEDYSVSQFHYEIQELEKGTKVTLGGKEVEIFKKGQYKIIKHDEGKIGLLKSTWASGSVLTGNASGKFFDKFISPRKNADGIECLYKVKGIGEDGLGYRYFTGPKRQNATKGQFYSGVPLERVEELKNGESKKYSPIINYYNYSADFGNIRHEGGVGFNSGKKPVKMLKNFIDIASYENKDFTVLDFFSGSASTAHAVMQKNAEDNGKRKYIMVQLAQETNENPEFKTISELGRERIRRAGQKIKEETKSEIDYGFKTFKLAETNINWEKQEYKNNIDKYILENVFMTPEQKEKLMQDFVEGSKDIDIVYEMLLRYYGMPLSASIAKMEDIGERTYIIDEKVIVCLEDVVTDEIIDKIASKKFAKLYLRDSSFKSEKSLEAKQNLITRLNQQKKYKEEKTYKVEFI